MKQLKPTTDLTKHLSLLKTASSWISQLKKDTDIDVSSTYAGNVFELKAFTSTGSSCNIGFIHLFHLSVDIVIPGGNDTTTVYDYETFSRKVRETLAHHEEHACQHE
jgi:hypothetical protein